MEYKSNINGFIFQSAREAVTSFEVLPVSKIF